VNKSRPTQLKRQRERAQAEKRQQKTLRRQDTKSRPNTPRGPGDEDPDIAGIKPGPQPSPYADFPGFADDPADDGKDPADV
jgi:hypothetical protein